MRYTLVWLAVIALGVLGLLIALGLGLAEPRISPQTFDRAVWASNVMNEEGRSPRLAMLPDLVRTHLRPGTPRREVEDLLGKPDSDNWSTVYPYPGWNVGTYPASSDSTGLMVRFDRAQRVREVYAPYWGDTRPYHP